MTTPRQLTETDVATMGRHPAVAQVIRWFVAGHLPDGPVRDTSELCAQLAHDMALRHFGDYARKARNVNNATVASMAADLRTIEHGITAVLEGAGELDFD